MSYIINRWGGPEQARVEDGTVDQSLDIKLVGKNYAGYGEIQNETFVHLLENFAFNEEPPKAISGQIWYDSQNKKLKVYIGETYNNAKVWKIATGTEYSPDAPQYPTPGDFWFDTSKDQLNVRIDQSWLTIGPQNAGTGLTQMVSKNVLDNLNQPHGIIAATVNGAVNFIISEDTFTLSSSDPDSTITGFTDPASRIIKRGITLPNSDSRGVTSTDTAGINGYKVWGTASDALRLGGKLPSEYLSPSNNILTLSYQVKIDTDEGLTVGANDDFSITVPTNVPIIASRLTNQPIKFSVKQANTPVFPLIVDQTGIYPGNGVGGPFSVGSLENPWENVYATNLKGIADKTKLMLVGTEYVQASRNSTIGTVAVRDSNKYLFADKFMGLSEKAEKLSTPRTINGVNFDGTAPITITDDTKLPLAGGTMTGALVLSGAPAADLQAATKLYVDNKFGVGGILGIAAGGTNAGNIDDARANLKVPRTDGVGATTNSTWNINIAPSLSPITVSALQASINATSGAATTTTIVVQNAQTTGSNIPVGAGYTDITSTTANTVATGSKTWTINKVTGYQLNTRVKVSFISNTSITMQGKITAVDNIALTITVLVDTIQGSGTNLQGWKFDGLGDTWRTNATVTGTAITGTVTISNIATDSPAIGSTTLTVTFNSQVVSGAVTNIIATDLGDGLGGNAATATKAKNISQGTRGDLPYQTAANTTTFLPIGTQGYLLSSTGSIPAWKDIASISVGTATQVQVTDRPTETEIFYPTFTSGGLPPTGSQARSIYVDQNLLTYNTNTNQLIVGGPTQAEPTNPYGSVVAKLNGTVLSPDGTVILNNGTGSGANATFSGKAASADKLQTSRKIELTGVIVGNQMFDGQGNIQIATTVNGSFSINLSQTEGSFVNSLVAGTFITLKEGIDTYTPGKNKTITVGVTAGSTGESNLVARDSSGNFSAGTITATLFNGTATAAQYADLAEKYLPDADYEAGTVVAVGGEAEVTASSYGDRALGVISTQPAYMMNKDLEGGVYVALKGRVPCKVIGSVRKGQRLVASNDGYAVAAVPHASDVFAIALQSSDDTGVKVIEVAVL
jgi:hypothetical protein